MESAVICMHVGVAEGQCHKCHFHVGAVWLLLILAASCTAPALLHDSACVRGCVNHVGGHLMHLQMGSWLILYAVGMHILDVLCAPELWPPDGTAAGAPAACAAAVAAVHGVAVHSCLPSA